MSQVALFYDFFFDFPLFFAKILKKNEKNEKVAYILACNEFKSALRLLRTPPSSLRPTRRNPLIDAFCIRDCGSSRAMTKPLLCITG